uniref:Uncharacterized protein n=1 Tax=Romanomermis culicivorax TaxID=13658 RepID=A0A915IXW4_ROMCU
MDADHPRRRGYLPLEPRRQKTEGVKRSNVKDDLSTSVPPFFRLMVIFGVLPTTENRIVQRIPNHEANLPEIEPSSIQSRQENRQITKRGAIDMDINSWNNNLQAYGSRTRLICVLFLQPRHSKLFVRTLAMAIKPHKLHTCTE